MNQHRQTYIELNPRNLAPREPGPIRIIGGATLALLGVWAITVFLFTL